MGRVKDYSLKEVAEKVGRSTATIVRWIDTRKVKITKSKNSQGHYIFTEADLQKLKSYDGMARVKGYSLKQVAAKVGRSTATIVRWLDTRKVKITKKKTAQGHYIFTEADLQKLKSYRDSIKQAN